MIDWIAKFLGYIIEWIYAGLASVGIVNIGVTIIIFSFVMRLILFPLTYKQQKNAKITQYIQPEMNKIAKKYRGKNDQDSMMKMQMEQQAIFKKYGTSPTSGCLPMLVQMPILFGIIKIVYNVPNYIPSVRKVYMNIAQPMVNAGEKVVAKMSDMAVELKASNYFKDYGSTSDVISLLYRFKDESWDKAKEIFSNFPDVINNINTYVPKINDLNDFAFGINIAEYPSSHGIFSIYILIPVLAALFQWIQMKTVQQPDVQDNSAAAMNNSMKMMMLITPVFSLFLYYSLPAGIGLYWAATAFFTIIQQVILNIHFDHIDMEKVIAKQVEKASKKKKPSMYDRLMDASMNAADQAGTTPNVPNGSYVNNKKTIGNAAKINTKKISGIDNLENSVYNGDSSDSNESKVSSPTSGSSGSISAIAHMLKDQ